MNAGIYYYGYHPSPSRFQVQRANYYFYDYKAAHGEFSEETAVECTIDIKLLLASYSYSSVGYL